MAVTLPTPGGDSGTWGTELNIWLAAAQRRIFNVELDPYNAESCRGGDDGSVTASDATFTAASGNFTAGDVGKTIIVYNGGDSRNQSHSSTIASVTSSTEVEMANNAGRTQANCHWLLGADHTTAIQAAIDAAADAEGGVVWLPGWYVTNGLVLKNRAIIEGLGPKSGGLILAPASNKPVVRNDTTSGNNAQFHGLRNIGINGSKKRQTAVSTTLSAGYTAGNTSLSLTDASAFLDAGVVTIGTNRLIYTSKSGNTLNGVVGGREGTTDASASNGATISQQKAHGFHTASVPVASQGANEEDFDAHWHLFNVFFNDCAGYGHYSSGRSTGYASHSMAYYCQEGGFRISFDTFLVRCESGQSGGHGFVLAGSSQILSNCKAWYSGNHSTSPGGNGFLIEPTSSQPVEGTTTLAGVIAQDNFKEGIYFRNADRTIGLVSVSSNGTSSVGTYAGARLESTNHCLLNILSTERVASPSNSQQNALQIDVASTNNQIQITHAAAQGSTVGTAIKSGSDLSGGNNILINGMGGARSQSVTTSYTPDPYEATTHRLTLGGALTVGAPTNAHLNAPLRFIFVQDATGGRTVAWNAAFKPGSWAVNPAPNGVSFIEFVYDGTNWITGAPSPVIGRGGSVLNPTGAINVNVWRAPHACTVTNVRAIRVGGTGATINARRNGSSNHLASALSLTSADTWTDGGAVQNTAYAAGDRLEIMVVTVSGSPTEIGIQVDFSA